MMGYSLLSLIGSFLLLLSETTSLEPIEVRIWEKKAAEIHAVALDHAMQGQYRPAAAHFRTACRLSPNNVKYLNDLGVTEMRMEQYDLALTRLAAAAKIDPQYKFTQQNLAELRRFVSADDYDRAMTDDRNAPPYPQLHELMCPRQISPLHSSLRKTRWYGRPDSALDIAAEAPSIGDLQQIYYSPDGRSDIEKLLSRPFVIRKAAQKWGWNLKALSTRMLQKQFGTARADFYPHNMGLETVHPVMTSLSNAMRQLELPDGVYENVDVFSGGATYIQWNIEDLAWNELLGSLNASLPTLLDDRYWFHKCFPDMRDKDTFSHKTHWRMVLIGNENAGMFNHRDTLSTASWQVQLKGKKKWHICSPRQEEYLYGAGVVDSFSPDYRAFPNMLNASCFQTTVLPGDFIYYPKGYWHQTKNLSPLTISITDTMVGRESHRLVAQELSDECQGRSINGRSIFQPDPIMCSKLEKCYAHWEEIYHPDTGASRMIQHGDAIIVASRDKLYNPNAESGNDEL